MISDANTLPPGLSIPTPTAFDSVVEARLLQKFRSRIAPIIPAAAIRPRFRRGDHDADFFVARRMQSMPRVFTCK